jgi:hypothetical protein
MFINTQELAMKSQPLPQSFNGRIQGFLFVIGISLLCLLAGGAVIWSGQEESGLRLATMVFLACGRWRWVGCFCTSA